MFALLFIPRKVLSVPVLTSLVISLFACLRPSGCEVVSHCGLLKVCPSVCAKPWLWHARYLVAAHRFLVVACGIYFPEQGLNLGSLHWELRVSPLDLQGNPLLQVYIDLCRPSEKAMAPHSSALAWKIPWAEEPGGLQSMGSLRVGHD